MLIELRFQESVFFVKLFTLESSRLNQQTASSEVRCLYTRAGTINQLIDYRSIFILSGDYRSKNP